MEGEDGDKGQAVEKDGSDGKGQGRRREIKQGGAISRAAGPFLVGFTGS